MKPMWKEGLYMMPQHFQALERHFEEEVDQRLGALHPHGFGVAELEIAPDALTRGLYEVRRLVAVMPDGLLVQIGPEHPSKAAVVMANGALSGGGPKAEVYLAVPSNATRGSSSYAGEPGAAGARLVRVTHPTPDAYGTAEDAELELVRPNVQLLLGSEDRANYVTLKLAELEVNEAGALVVSERYVPPCLSTTASQALTRRLSGLVTLAAAKQTALAGRYRGRSTSLVEFGSVDMVTFWYLYTLNASVPVLQHLASTGRAHPERLYLTLTELVGRLATFEPQRKPKDLPRYEHLQLAESLYPIFDQLSELLATVIAQQYKSLPLEQPQPGLFLARGLDQTLLKKSQLYLVASGEIPENTLRQELPLYVRVSSYEQITNVVHAAVPGLELQVDLSPPTAIPVKPDNVYLRFGQAGSHWQDILKSGTIAIFQPLKPQQVKLELLAVEL